MIQQIRTGTTATLLSSADDHVSKGPRLQPIEKPSGFMLRLIYWLSPRQLGKVPTSIKVLAARAPKSMKLFSAMGKYETKGIRLDKDTPLHDRNVCFGNQWVRLLP